jgi:hypothetical protein
MPIITPERAGQIRGELTEKYGATWMHEYAGAVEAAIRSHFLSTEPAERAKAVGDWLGAPIASRQPSLSEVQQWVMYDPETGFFARVEGQGNARADRAMKTGYRSLSIFGKQYAAHRVAWLFITGQWPPADRVIDHINGQKDDNRACNLRTLSHSLNALNLQGPKKKFKNHDLPLGVLPHGKSSFRAQIKINRQQIVLGSFATPEEASAAYQKAASKAFENSVRFLPADDSEGGLA